MKTYYYFYHPVTEKIIGMSDYKDSMEFPYVKSKEKHNELDNLEIRNKKLVVTEKITLQDRIGIMRSRGRKNNKKLTIN